MKINFVPAVPEDRTELYFFPYVGVDGRLHLWDIDRAQNVARLARGSGKTKEGYSAKEVQRSWPKLFALAVKEGFWRDD